jgi:molybdopterin synthase sulfur carrier subunit
MEGDERKSGGRKGVIVATVFIPSQLRDMTGGVGQVEIAAANVRQIVDELESRFPGIRARLCVGDALSPSLQVSIDGEMSTRGLSAKVKPRSEVHFVPAIGGG